MTRLPLSHLGDMPVQTFIDEYWQKKPLLIRQAFPNYQSPISADELAGLSLEEDIESRIIIERGKKPWQLMRGPFAENVFSELPESHWTLLVQSLDLWVPEITELLDYFRFIPNWRLDDIMASYAVDGGSVGPHFDQYDVFLLQAAGQRHWQIGQYCTQNTPRLEGTELHILKEFEASQEWTLEPGDMLYLPPQLAHHGRAVGDECITFSVGFRAPSHAELLSDYLDEQLSKLTEDQRYTDPDLHLSAKPGMISDEAIEQVRATLSKSLENRETIGHWFGRYMTSPKSEIEALAAPDAEIEHTVEHELYQRNPHYRFAYIDHGEMASVFINGEEFESSQKFAEMLCNFSEIEGQTLLQSGLDSCDQHLLQILLENDILYTQ